MAVEGMSSYIRMVAIQTFWYSIAVLIDNARACRRGRLGELRCSILGRSAISPTKTRMSAYE
ncbi:hypothetical protein MES5069_440017 [Mesorhizobium escarrei]|uniref:Uncharacterized protein n=1 Tax=Mesorhizobium escarrei TaxID=666018 RepID=A0ABN8K5N5_9HYPH|nr:hypothetical protein MES5069_440017 [Mesorhizobium escarrei]